MSLNSEIRSDCENNKLNYCYALGKHSEWNPLLCSHFSVNAFPTESLTLFSQNSPHLATFLI